ncbi:MAG: S1 family peptidase, partial [Polyangiales bacterium]
MVRPRGAVRVGLVAAALATAVAGCAVAPPDRGEVASRTGHIVDGEAVDGSRPAVVLVYNRAGGLCTGTLISPRVVLTAKHCVQREGASEPFSPSAFSIGVGDNARGLSEQFTVQSLDTTPGSYSAGLRDLTGNDVAVMTLTTGAPIEPIPIRRETPNDVVRETATAIGFGERPEGSAGLKYETTTTVNGVTGNVIYTPPTICQGDSGGPLIDPDGQVFGVASFGTGDCGSGLNGYNSIDAYLDMIDTAIGESGECLDDGEEVCDGFDNDCNDMVDEVCADLGESCETVADCVGGEGGGLLCEETSAGKICTRPCDPLRPFMGCAADQYCARTSSCDGLCVPGRAGDKGNDEPCEEDTECASLLCADPGDREKRCLTPCQGDAGMCYAGEVCAATPGQCNGCVQAGLVRGLRGVGEPCDSDDACHSGVCFLDEGFVDTFRAEHGDR